MKQPHFWTSVCHALSGLAHTFRTQRNARIDVVIALVIFGMAIWLKLDAVRFSIIVLAMGAVLAGETINTAVEAIVDLLSPEWHERAKIAKDVSAGAVLILAIMTSIVGLLILGPPLWQQIFSQNLGS